MVDLLKLIEKYSQQIKDLPPRTELPSVRSRWYDFLRDPYDLNKPKVVPSNPFMPDNGPMPRDNVYYILNYLKDYWQIALIATGGVIILGGGLYFFWDPITSGTSYSWSAIKGSYESIIQYFTTKAPEHTGTGGADGGDNPLLGPVDESSQIELTDFTPRNREGAVPLNSSPRSLLSRADEFVQGHSRSDTQVVRDLIAKSPKVPSTPLDSINQGGFFTQDTFSVSQDIAAESTGRFTQSLAEGTNPETRPVITVTPSPNPWRNLLPFSDSAEVSSVINEEGSMKSGSTSPDSHNSLDLDLQGTGYANKIANSPILRQANLNPDNFSAPTDAAKAADSLIQNASGPRTFPKDFTNS